MSNITNDLQKKTPLFAVLDVETTGGRPINSKITEIAVILSDGKNILKEFSSLVNPMRPIDGFVVRLTGITDNMVSTAPIFSAIASQIKELLQDAIIVAHNVDFDFQMLQREFIEVGDYLTNQKLCTVKSSKKIFKDVSSFNLGNLCKHLDIPLTNAHRAYDDTLATTHLLHKLLSMESFQFFTEELLRQNYSLTIPTHWQEIKADEIESKEAVFQLCNIHSDIIFIEYATNFRKKMYSIIDGAINNDPKYAKLVQETHFVTYNYSELGIKAEMQSSNLIQLLKPKFNKPFKPTVAKYILYFEKDDLGLFYLKIHELASMSDHPKGYFLYAASYRSCEKIKAKLLTRPDIKALLFSKKSIEKMVKNDIEPYVNQYNNNFIVCFEELCCPFEEGYYIFKIADSKAEGVYVHQYYIHSWVSGIISENKLQDISTEFIFEDNHKMTRKFLNILGKYSHKKQIIKM